MSHKSHFDFIALVLDPGTLDDTASFSVTAMLAFFI